MQHAMNNKSLLNEHVENSNKIKVVMRLKSVSQSSKIIMDHILISFQDTSEVFQVQRHIMALHTWVPQNRPFL